MPATKSAKKRVLLVLPEAFNCAGGIQMFCRALCLAAGQWSKENAVLLNMLVLNDDSVPDARYVTGNLTSYVGTGKSKTKLIRQYIRHILTTQYDLIVFGHVSLSPLALLSGFSNPHVRIITIAYGIEVWRPLTRSQRKALQRADVILAISEFTKEELIKHNGIGSEKIKIFPCTLDPFWKQTETSTNLECTPPAILSVTRMNKEDRYKGIDKVIGCLPRVLEEVGPVQYRIVGEGSDVPRLRALATGLGVERYVDFLGGVTDAELREQYKQCSLFVMPSRKEGFGIVFLEAMAYGKPVIGGAHGGTPSVIKDGETGMLVDNSDVEGIAKSIARLLRDEGMREDLGRAGRRRLLSEFTFDRFEQNLNEVFLSLS